MSLIACWTLVTCPHCGDLWHDCFLGDGSTYECANCGRQGIGVPTPVTREDVGAAEALRLLWDDIRETDKRFIPSDVRAKVDAALAGRSTHRTEEETG